MQQEIPARLEAPPAGLQPHPERQREQDRLGELVGWPETEHGPVTDEELAAAEAERREIERARAERARAERARAERARAERVTEQKETGQPESRKHRDAA
ncbi:hypothetical protein AB0M25_14080 [Streptomyces griseomycini]|uniref:hypothetical protein n=1 Tax=Streptomyces griseomycini TaxID=66895 RepID=UPI003420C1E6